MTIRSALPLALLLIACGVNEDNFADKFAHVLCSQAEECYPDDFDDSYEDFGECLDDMAAYMDDVQRTAEQLCEIDYEIASECYADLKSMSCDEIDEGQSPPACGDYVVCF
jgi:hypothetical protein